MSIWEAASPPSSQGFVLAGTLIMLLPAILGYTWWSYSRVPRQGRRGQRLSLRRVIRS